MSGQGTHTIVLANEGQLLAQHPQPDCAIEITSVSYQYSSEADGTVVLSLEVNGLAWDVETVNVRLNSPLISAIRDSATVTNDKTWSLSFDLSGVRLPYGANVVVTASSGGEEECQASKTVRLSLRTTDDGSSALYDAFGCSSGFNGARNRFVAGHADRFIFSRSFVPLISSYWIPTVTDKGKYVRFVSSKGLPRIAAAERLEQFVERAVKIGTKGLEEGIAEKEIVVSALEKAFNQTFRSEIFEPPQKEKRRRKSEKAAPEGEELDSGPDAAKQPATDEMRTSTVEEMFAASGVRIRKNVPPEVGETSDIRESAPNAQAYLRSALGEAVAVESGVSSYTNLGWLGIMFYDRLRFRPSGLLAGDQVFSLSLAPGEETTLTQRSETKRTRSFEEVVDRTTEQELEFSSTWSTDFTQQDANSVTDTMGGNLGVSVSGPIAEGVNAGVNAGANAQTSNTTSSNTQRTRSQQVTARVSARAREQHKTTFKVGTELTEEFGSKRTVRNLNPSRALTLHAYKIYEKFRVVLERYDSKLCASLLIADPGRDLRDELDQELDKLEPKVPSGVCTLPASGTMSQELIIETFDHEDWGNDDFGWAVFSTILPFGTVLSSWNFELTEWWIDEGDGTVRQADLSKWKQSGGDHFFLSSKEPKPETGSSGAQSHMVHVRMPEAWGIGWWTVRVKARFTWNYVPSDALSAEVRQCMENEKKKIRDSFSSERVMQILDEVKSGQKDLIFKRVFQNYVLPGFFNTTNPPLSVIDVARNLFDWNEAFVEYLPWWMSTDSRQRRDSLRQRLLRLPGDTRSDLVIDDTLVAAAARVFLPIKQGLELLAVQLLAGPSAVSWALEAAVADLVKWRNDNCGQIAVKLPSYDEILSPNPSTATPEGASHWETDWEKPRRKFIVLDEWSELFPTDGVHFEPVLSSCGSADEFRTSALISDLKSAAATQETRLSRAELERAIAADPEKVRVEIGDPD